MVYKKLLDGIVKYGSNIDEICRQFIGVEKNCITESVIVAPWWEPRIFLSTWHSFEYLSISETAGIKVWNIEINGKKTTYIRTGIGAPVLTDVILALGVTNCRKILFLGSVGSLTETVNIGDIVIPQYSMSGDGVSRYLGKSTLSKNECFAEKAFPDHTFFNDLCHATEKFTHNTDAKYHICSAFSIDTIFSQFAYIDEILEMGCTVIEMETAAAFKAANIAKISMAALLSVSDNTIMKKSLISGRTRDDMEYRRRIRQEVFPMIIEDVL